ncbi:MAG: glutamate-5-semialdehyde dehydrogenase [Nitrospirae bacterium]|nr:glutamate-5-semialdehyde dehydrogenase [Candidatus Manganitrophaceae bacterium]
MALKDQLRAQATETKKAAGALAKCSTEIKNRALLAMADDLERHADLILAENAKDLAAGKEKGLAGPLLERLALTSKRIGEMAAGLREVAALPDPVGEVLKMIRRPNGIQVGQMRVPIGVIGIIYESRPNVTVDAAALCIKSGNGVLLRGGSEAIHSNTALARQLEEAGRRAGLPPHAITLIETTDRQAIFDLLTFDDLIDLIIPRGGEGLIRTVVEHSKIPVMKHDKGICHTFVDESADLRMAEEICLNAKVQRPSTCNAMETLLVHRKVAATFLPKVAKRFQESVVELRGCPETQALLKERSGLKIVPAEETDWRTEYLDLILSVKVVDSIDAAMEHIVAYGSQHSEAIITQDYGHAMRFLNEVDASAVFVNASTRLNDGYELGLGAEMGISTSRIHARGPMGLEALTCTKFIIFGDGQIRR